MYVLVVKKGYHVDVKNKMRNEDYFLLFLLHYIVVTMVWPHRLYLVVSQVFF